MPDNRKLNSCLHQHGTALVFAPPGSSQPQTTAATHIINILTMEVVTGAIPLTSRQHELSTSPRLALARDWPLHVAVQIIQSQPQPELWVALLMHKRAWGLFWAGGGWQRCRLLQERRRNRWTSRLWRHVTEGVIRRLGSEADPDVLRAVLVTSMAWAALLLLVVLLLGSSR